MSCIEAGRKRETAGVLFPRSHWEGLADGTITVAFRRWVRPTVRTGGSLRSPVGVLAIDEVITIDEADITDADARSAGADDRAAVVAALRPEGTLYRIRFHLAGADPRVALRERDELGEEELAGLLAALARLPWAVDVLSLIADQPGVVSTELAALQREERLTFKRRVRRLKELGLTESLPVGYRLAPRGRTVLGALLEQGASPGPGPAPPD
jgi:hypothetical protein